MKRALVFPFLALMVIAGLAAATATMSVPAVDTENRGILTTISARALTGNGGGVYVDVEPFVSVETQNSGKTAAKIAAEQAGVRLADYTVLFKVNTSAEIVDGPSGGVALTLLAYSEFARKTLREDMTATGTMELDGSVGKVGGVASKLEAAAAKGVKLFIIPVDQSAEEGVDLAELGESKYGMQVVEVANAKEAIALAFTPKGSRVNAPSHTVPPLALINIAANRSADALGLKWVAEREYAETEGEVDGLMVYLNGSSASIQAARRSLNLSSQLLDNGYYYSAANNVFLLKINAEAMAMYYRNVTAAMFGPMVDGLLAEIEGYNFTAKTAENWEWVVGGQLRWHWARDRLDLVQIDMEDGIPAAGLFRDYALAKSWFSAARKMDEWAKGRAGGALLNETNLMPLAERMLAKADEAAQSNPDPELDAHIAGSQQAFDDGHYLASAFDSQFILSFTDAWKASRSRTAVEIGGLLSNESLSSFKSYWAEEYFAHSLYNIAEANRSAGIDYLSNTLKLQYLADGLDSLAANISAEASIPFGGTAPIPSGTNRSSKGKAPGEVAEPSGTPGFQVTVAAVPQDSNTQKLIILVSVAVIVAAIAVLALVVRSRMPHRRRGERLVGTGVLDRLDELLLEKRIGEATYLRLRAKYEAGKGLGGIGPAEEKVERERKEKKLLRWGKDARARRAAAKRGRR